MELEVSQKTQKVCKTFKLNAEALAFADLCAVGWEPEDAFIVAFHKGSTWIKRALKEEVAKMLKSELVQARMADTKEVLSARQKAAIKQTNKKERDRVIDAAMSKEQMLYDLQTAKAKHEVGSKEWLDTNKLIVDVTRMKQDEVKQDDKTIVYHLPVHYPTGCQDCLYQRCESCRYKKAYEEGG